VSPPPDYAAARAWCAHREEIETHTAMARTLTPLVFNRVPKAALVCGGRILTLSALFGTRQANMRALGLLPCVALLPGPVHAFWGSMLQQVSTYGVRARGDLSMAGAVAAPPKSVASVSLYDPDMRHHTRA
jgi:hypothetical protein